MFVAEAPVIGHGTGSITDMFRRAAVGKSGVGLEVSSNPHNQTFAVAIQLGLVGATLLWAMWIAHLVAFRGGGSDRLDRTDCRHPEYRRFAIQFVSVRFTEGWIYVIGIGVTAGLVRRKA